jgi:uncharacterized repeat protein (TIGR03843 family)
LAPEEEGEILRLLEEGEIEILGLMPRASNYTFLARIGNTSGEQTLAVYKPERGEAPLWDFPAGTLHRREIAAFRVARALGWPWVPPTVLRDGPEGPGSVQLFIPFDPEEHYFTLAERMPDEFRRVALFDAVVNNADRKSGHCLMAESGRVFLIDHGVCFHVAPKLRTVIWDFAGDEIPEVMLDDLMGAERELAPGGALNAELAELLDGEEVAASHRRTAELVEHGRFPEPGSERPYPWPPV